MVKSDSSTRTETLAMNLSIRQTGELDNFGTLKAIPLPDEEPSTAQTSEVKSNDDVLLSSTSSESVSSRTQQWPK